MSFPRFSLSSFVTLFSFQGTIFYIDFKFKQVCVQFAFSSTSSRTSVRKTEKKCEMCVKLFELVEMRRIELLTPCLQGRCSPSWATPPNFSWYLIFGFNFSYVTNVQPTVGIIFAYVPPCYGNFVAYRSASLHDFTPARSYDVSHCYAMLVVGLSGLEPPTSRLSGVRSNRLSYRPMQGFYWVQFPFPTYINISLWMFILFYILKRKAHSLHIRDVSYRWAFEN